MDKMFSCDWGTSSFRLRLVNSSDLSILAARVTGQGIASTHALWAAQLQAGQSGAVQPLQGSDRLHFYQTILSDGIKSIEQELGYSLAAVPLVISGMASSTLGMLELPYKELPFFADGSDLLVQRIAASTAFDHETILISGARTSDDVMRGEETQLVGCEVNGDHGSGNPGLGGEQVLIFPGTHSKHIWVRDGKVVRFKTYMTGEFFALLSKKSILSGSVGLAGGEEGIFFEKNREHRFEEGVREGARGDLLHSAFLVRTNQVLQGMSKEENYGYLSGLLIGAELSGLAGRNDALKIVGEGPLKNYYVIACRLLGIKEVSVLDGGEAVLRGQRRASGLEKP